jgi:hypothetical protein
MKVHITKSYYKVSRKGREPAKFHATQKGGLGHDVHAKVKLDPILKKHKDLERGIMKHEKTEIEHWGHGHPASQHVARFKEPKLTRTIGGVSGFWKEIEKRERRG